MKKRLLKAGALAVLGWTVVFGAGGFDLKQLGPAHVALYGAMRAGYIVGSAGGTEADVQIVFMRIKGGETNAVQDWLNSRK